jgi:hypothetical protein
MLSSHAIRATMETALSRDRPIELYQASSQPCFRIRHPDVYNLLAPTKGFIGQVPVSDGDDVDSGTVQICELTTIRPCDPARE